MSRESSLSRKLRRGTACIVLNSVTKSSEIVMKKGSTKKQWDWALKNMSIASEQSYNANITKQLSQADIENSEERHIYKLNN